MDPKRRNDDVIVDYNSSTVLQSRQTRIERLEANRLPARSRRRGRRSIYSEPRIQSLSTITWVRRLFVLSLIAPLHNTNKGFATVCDAFVTPTRKSTNAIRSEHWKIPNTQNRRTITGTTTISKRTHRNKEISTCSSSNGPASGNDMTTNSNNKKQKKAEIAGFFLAVAIILSLAVSGPSDDEVGSASVAVMTKVVENTVPTTSTEVVAVTLGESIGGVIGAVSSVAINFVLRGGKVNDDSSDSSDSEKSKEKKSLLSQGLADSDYFIANSASNSLLEAAGVPETIAKYSSVFIAAIPSQLVKITPRLTERKMSLPMFNENEGKTSMNVNPFFWKRDKKVEGVATITDEESVTAAAAAATIDFVEVFADITRWLEYDVLKTEYGETAISQFWMVGNNLSTINPIQSAITFALLGSLAAVSSRWYADCLYGRFRYGPVEKQNEVRRRSSAEWFSIYSSTAASAAALFGCYEFFQLPIGRYIQGTLSGGVEGCVGSSSFNACMQTFIDTNSPGPTAEAQFRALVTNLYAVYVRLQDIAGDTTTADMAALIRAWSVSAASYIANM